MILSEEDQTNDDIKKVKVNQREDVHNHRYSKVCADSTPRGNWLVKTNPAELIWKCRGQKRTIERLDLISHSLSRIFIVDSSPSFGNSELYQAWDRKSLEIGSHFQFQEGLIQIERIIFYQLFGKRQSYFKFYKTSPVTGLKVIQIDELSDDRHTSQI